MTVPKIKYKSNTNIAVMPETVPVIPCSTRNPTDYRGLRVKPAMTGNDKKKLERCVGTHSVCPRNQRQRNVFTRANTVRP